MLNLVNQYTDSNFIYGNRQKISLTSVNDRPMVNFFFTKPQYIYGIYLWVISVATVLSFIKGK